jgi:hypothetical protein
VALGLLDRAWQRFLLSSAPRQEGASVLHAGPRAFTVIHTVFRGDAGPQYGV